MPVHKTLVLVLRGRDYSETSQVVDLLGRETGRLRALAKGSKRGKNPFGGPLDRWTLGEAVFSLPHPDRLATLMELYELERFRGLREQLPAFLGACAVTEMVLVLAPDLDPQPPLFDLVVDGLRQLASAERESIRALTLALPWRILALLGYEVDPGRCVQCGRALDAKAPARFSGGLGGLVCGSCSVPDQPIALTGKAVEAIRFLASAEWEDVRRVRLTEATAEALRSAVKARVEALADRPLSALQYV